MRSKRIEVELVIHAGNFKEFDFYSEKQEK